MFAFCLSITSASRKSILNISDVGNLRKIRVRSLLHSHKSAVHRYIAWIKRIKVHLAIAWTSRTHTLAQVCECTWMGSCLCRILCDVRVSNSQRGQGEKCEKKINTKYMLILTGKLRNSLLFTNRKYYEIHLFSVLLFCFPVIQIRLKTVYSPVLSNDRIITINIKTNTVLNISTQPAEKCSCVWYRMPATRANISVGNAAPFESKRKKKSRRYRSTWVGQFTFDIFIFSLAWCSCMKARQTTEWCLTLDTWFSTWNKIVIGVQRIAIVADENR